MTKLATYYEQAQPIKEYVNEMTTNKEQLLIFINLSNYLKMMND